MTPLPELIFGGLLHQAYAKSHARRASFHRDPRRSGDARPALLEVVKEPGETVAVIKQLTSLTLDYLDREAGSREK